MNVLRHATLTLLVCLVVGCERKPGASIPPRNRPESAELSIKLQGGVEYEIPLKLDDSSKGTYSYSANAAAGRNFATSISYDYAGEVDLHDNYNPGNPVKGHLIAFRVSQFDPRSNKATYSEILHGIYSGESVSIHDRGGIRLRIHPSNGEPGTGGGS